MYLLKAKTHYFAYMEFMVKTEHTTHIYLHTDCQSLLFKMFLSNITYFLERYFITMMIISHKIFFINHYKNFIDQDEQYWSVISCQVKFIFKDKRSIKGNNSLRDLKKFTYSLYIYIYLAPFKDEVCPYHMIRDPAGRGD